MDSSKGEFDNEKKTEIPLTDKRQSPSKSGSGNGKNDDVRTSERESVEGVEVTGPWKSSAINVPQVSGSESKGQSKGESHSSAGCSSPAFSSCSPGRAVFSSGSPGPSGFIPGSPGSTNFAGGSPGGPAASASSPAQSGFFAGSPGHFGFVPGSPGRSGSPKFIPSSPSKGGLVFDFDDKQRQLLFDLAVIHECNMDREFLVDPKHEPPKNLLEVLSHKIDSAFWEDLEKELKEEPPELDKALNLVSDIKQGLDSILLPWHNRIREDIAEVLDQDLIKQQAENGIFDFKKCANYIINLMAKLCAPIRDEGIEELRKIDGVVPTFKAIFGMLNLMRIDMINYHLIAFRGELLRNGRKYERAKFDQYLKLSDCGLLKTQRWLGSYAPAEGDKEKRAALVKAFLELFEWNEARLKLEIPEPLCHDVHRILELSAEYFSLIITASVVVVSGGYFSGKAPFDEAFKTSLKDNLSVLLKGVNGYNLVERVMPNITEQIVKMVRDRQKAKGWTGPPAEEERQSLSGLLSGIGPSHPVCSLMRGRLNDALIALLTTPKDKLHTVALNSSLLYMTREIHRFAASFSFLFTHSLYVYGDYMYKFLSPNNTDFDK